MAGPDRINPNDVKWNGPGAEKQRDAVKDDASVDSSKAGAASSRVNAAEGIARLPYIAPKAAADVKKAEADAAKAQKDLEEMKKGRFLDPKDSEALGAFVDGLSALRDTRKTFKPNYVGTFFDWPTELESSIQKGWSEFGTPGQATWWQRMKRLDMIERNKYFGASLTGGEKEAWNATTVSPGMDPDLVEANLKMREEIITKVINRTVKTLRAGNYRPAQIDAALGEFNKEFAPTTDRVAGEEVKGKRLSDEDEAALVTYVRSPEFTPEGYAELLTEKALKAGLVTPEQVPEYKQHAIEETRKRYEGTTPEQRKETPGYLDYTDVDKQAMDEAGAGTVALQALRNVPESAVQLLEGVMSPGIDAIRSGAAGERTGLYKTLPDLAGELGSQAMGGGEGETTKAMIAALKQRYNDPKRLLATDPLGVLGDASVVLGGAGVGLRAARLGKMGDMLSTAGRAIDPLRLGTALPGDIQALRAKYPTVDRAVDAVTNVPGAVTRHTLGLSTGVVGGEGYGRAFSAGAERGRAGAPTPRSENFTKAMRGGDDGADVVAQAEEAVRAMQRDASDAYRSGFADVQNDATVLDFADIDKALNDLSGRAFYKGQVRDPNAAKVFEDVGALVEEWKGLDPAQFHTPEGMDALKQRIGGIADTLNSDNNPRAASIATGVYGSVKDSIARQVPSYAATMKGYEEAQDLLRQIKTSFSMSNRAGVDTKLRKLQSVLRNNANTDYGYRTNLAKMLDAKAPKPILDTLSAHSVRSWQPRGLAGVSSGALATSGIGGLIGQAFTNAPSFLDPTALLALPATSPRLMGEASYGLGRAYGTARRGARAAVDSAPAQKLGALYQKYPTAVLAAGQTGSRSDEVEDLKKRMRLLDLPGLTPDDLGY